MKKYKNSLKLIVSLIFISINISLLIAFNSYWTNGLADQSEIILNNTNFNNIKNSVGGLGATASEFFIRTFGISVYFLNILIFFFLIKFMFIRTKINLFQISTIHIFLILWTSLLCSLFTNKIFAGKIGVIMSNAIIPLLGQVGTVIILTLSISVLIILLFDIKLEHLYKIKKLTKFIYKHINTSTNEMIVEKQNDLEPASKLEHTNDLEPASKLEHINDLEPVSKLEHTNDLEPVNKDDIIIEEIKEEDILNKNIGDNSSNQELKIKYEFPDLEILTEYAENKISINEVEVETTIR